MYESFFELSERPFASVPRADRYFPGVAIEGARKQLTRCIERAEGPALLIGTAGTGKSLVCHVLADQFRSSLAIVQLANARLCSRRALLQAILFELGLPYREMAEGELRLSLIDRLSNGDNGRAGALLLVDEAHGLPLSLLEEIRMITNLVRDGQPRVRLVLAGLPALEERFASPKLDCFNQRLAARCYLDSLNETETMQYVRAQLAASGGDADRLFLPDALAAVYSATDGVPRLINQLCDHALLMASAGGVRQLTVAGIEEAWSDLLQLPTPWRASPGAPPRTGENVIEFGCLADEDPGADSPTTGDSPSAATAPPEVQIALQTLAETAGPGPCVATDPDCLALDAVADTGFEPAGSIGPEVELLCGGQPSPFAERFDDEEVVIDQYAALEENVFCRQPRVAARGDSMPLHLLRALSAPEDRPSLSLAGAAGELDDEPSVNVAPTAQRAPASQGLPADRFGGHAAGLPYAKDDRVSPSADVRAADALAEDHDLIILEDDADGDEAVAAIKPIRADEYRQLFAQLRRG